MLRSTPLPSLALLAFGLGCGPSVLAPEPPAAPASQIDTERSRAEAAAWLDGRVAVRAGGLVVERSRRDLGATLGAPTAGQPTTEAARSVDEARARAFLAELAREVDREPAPGVVDLRARTLTPHVEGRRLLVDASHARLARALVEGATAVELEVERTLPAEGVVPEGLALDAILGEYSTRFDTRGRYRTRAHNVRLAASSLDGAILAPGGTLSFNEAVGPRETRRGYKLAPVILEGELVPGIGGGVCQAASTLHAAAFFAGLDFPVYQPHSRPSSYIPIGLDATVAYPDVDLVVRNPFPFPVIVSATSAEDTLTVRILGRERPRHVELVRQIHRGEAYESRDVEDPALPLGARERTQEGAAGSVVLRTRLLVEGAQRWVERERLEYPATDEIFHVGTGPSIPLAEITPASVVPR